MSQTAPDGYYVFQPDPPREDGRIYAVCGLPLPATIRGLTRQEAEACKDALTLLTLIKSLAPVTKERGNEDG